MLMILLAATEDRSIQHVILPFAALFILFALITGIWGLYSKKRENYGTLTIKVVGLFIFYVVSMNLIRAIKVTIESQ